MHPHARRPSGGQVPDPDHSNPWRLLPTLRCAGAAFYLPFPQTTEIAWLQASLANDPQPLTEALALDPALVVWAWFGSNTPAELNTLDKIANWLLGPGLDPGRWQPKDISRPEAAAFRPHRWRQLAVASVVRARTHATETCARNPAFVQELMHNAVAWVEAGAGERCRREVPCDLLPAPLREAFDTLHADAKTALMQSPLHQANTPGVSQWANLAAERWQVEQLQGPLWLPHWVVRRLASASSLADSAGLPAALVEDEKLAALAEFAAGAGHEINNPIAVISGRAQLLLTAEIDPERRRDLATIHAQAVRVHEMIADLMYFARPPQSQPQSIELVSSIDILLAELARQEVYRHVVFRRVGAEGPLNLEADRAQLLAAVRAVCLNSLFAMSGRGLLEIELSQEGTPAAETRIAVRDQGPGISPEVRRHLFDPYFSGRESGRGLGIGLSKVWQIVQAHGGRIELASEPGRGTTLTLIFPTQPRACECGDSS